MQWQRMEWDLETGGVRRKGAKFKLVLRLQVVYPPPRPLVTLSAIVFVYPIR